MEQPETDAGSSKNANYLYNFFKVLLFIFWHDITL